MLELNRKCEINHQKFSYTQLDEIERDLLYKMLVKNLGKRQSASELLKNKLD